MVQILLCSYCMYFLKSLFVLHSIRFIYLSSYSSDELMEFAEEFLDSCGNGSDEELFSDECGIDWIDELTGFSIDGDEEFQISPKMLDESHELQLDTFAGVLSMMVLPSQLLQVGN